MKVPSKFNYRLWLAIALASCILATFGITLFSPKQDPTPTVYHHLDGTFSLNQKHGPKVTPDEVLNHLMKYETFGAVRLMSSPKTLLSDWEEVISKATESGAASYRFEVDDTACRFHVPLCGPEPDDSLTPEIQFLEGIDTVPKMKLPNTDVIIIGDDFVTCKEVIDASLAHTQRGKSVAVIAGNYLLRHNRFENERGIGDFTPRHPDFWTKHIQPSLDRLRSLF